MDFCIVQNGQMGIKKIIHLTKRSFVIDIFAAMTTENPQAFRWEAFFFGGGGSRGGGIMTFITSFSKAKCQRYFH